MKLRIKGNSIRLRLSKPEVEKLAIDAYLEECTSFADNILVYTLQSVAGIHELSASFDGDKISVFIPENFTKDWVVNDVIGLDASMHVSGNESLYILVEKDFKCLEKTNEDQSENYENPNRTC